MNDRLEEIVPRRISELLGALAEDEPVVALHGPRSVGKSTVLRSYCREAEGELLDLDDINVLEAVRGNLSATVKAGTPLCVDEYQKLPAILDAIKARLNEEGSQPGTAVVTGSTRQDALPQTAQALTGRIHPMTIWPLSQGEIAGVREDLLECLWANPEEAVQSVLSSDTLRSEYVERVCAGGMPLALRRSASARGRWFDDFVRTSVERDAAELSSIRDRQALFELFRFLTSQTAQLLNITAVAQQLGLNRRTAESHLRLLEDLFLVSRLGAWGKTLRSRVTSAPKIHVVDSGVAARLLQLTPAKLTGLDPQSLSSFGHLLETFVVGELRKQASWLEEGATLGHWRTSDGVEVDLVMERPDGSILAFEVKANERAPGSDFKGLQQLRDLTGDRFVAGVVFTTGPRSYTYEDRLHVLPVDRLWTPVRHSD